MKTYLLKRVILAMSLNLFSGIIFSFAFAGALLAEEGNAQNNSLKKVFISVDLYDVTVKNALDIIENETQFKFIYEKKILSEVKAARVTLKSENKSVAFVLKKIANNTGFSFRNNDGVIGVNTDTPLKVLRLSMGEKSTYSKIVEGKVTNENGEPLPGANIVVKGSNIGTNSDIEGNYRLSMPDSATTLLFSYIGYLTEEVEIAGRSVIDVVMVPDVAALEGVTVSTGYWEVDELLNTGNIAKIDAEIIDRQPVVDPLQAIQGRVAGVQIQQTSGIPGSELNINIRGLNSLNNGQQLEGGVQLPNANSPFFVVDGVPFPSNSLNASGIGGLTNGSPLAAIRPSDIESIEVLKDADATAIYGSRGANGVILITTKKGQAGKTKINLNLSNGVGQVTNRVDLLNTEQYLMLRREGIANDGRALNDGDSAQLVDLFVWDQERFTDWQEELLGGTARQTNAELSLSGGTAQTQFLVRGSFFRQTNIFNFDNSAFESGSGHFNLNQRSRDNRLNVSLSTTYTVSANDQNAIGLTNEALTLPPNAPSLFDENGDINFADGFDNPLAFIEQEYGNKTRNLITNLLVSYEILPNLTLKSSFGYNSLTTDEFSIEPVSSRPPEGNPTGVSTLSESFDESWIIEPQLQYNCKLGKGVLSALVGSTFQGSIREGLTILALGFESDVLIRDLLAAPTLFISNNNFSEYRYTAVYGRLNYSWEGKYILNLTGRRDGSSRFGPDRQFGNFGAVGTAWIFSEEGFIKNNLSFLSFGKLRASYGLTGNDQIGDYNFLNTYSASSGDAGAALYDGSAALILSRAANPEFSWETNRKLELGLEVGVLQDRIKISTSWFRNRSSDQLIGQPLSSVTGFTTTQFNLPALVENRGIELDINTVNVVAGEFVWSTSINFTRYRNELVEFPNIEAFSPFNNRYIVGESTFGRKHFQTLGVNPETGEYEFVDFNNNGNISIDDQQDFVEIVQDYFGGFNNTLKWRGFQLDFFFQFVKQNGPDINLINAGSVGSFRNLPIGVLARWQNPGDITAVRRASRFGAPRPIGATNAALTDASYLRLQNVSLSWQLPETLIQRAKLSQARLYVNGQNLWTLTDFEGLDPETGNISLPPLRIITTGIQLTF